MKSLVTILLLVCTLSRSSAFLPPSPLVHSQSCKRSDTSKVSSQEKYRQTTKLELSPTIKWAVGHALGGLIGTPAVISATKTNGWYRGIEKPPWTPPDPLFGMIWSFMYVLMGVATSMVYYTIKQQTLTTTRTVTNVMTLWWIHYALNLSWTPVFFGLKKLRLGLAINILLVTTLSVLILPAYFRIQPLAAILLVPYLLWLLFATALNRAICRLNPTKNGYNQAMFQADMTSMKKKAANDDDFDTGLQ